MTVTAGVFFLGEYRPAYFEADTVGAAIRKATLALASVAEPRWFIDRLIEAEKQLKSESCAAFASEHGCRGVSVAKRPHDAWLDSVTAKLPAYPGLDYSTAVNA